MPALLLTLPPALDHWLKRRDTPGMLLVMLALTACALLLFGQSLPPPLPALVRLLGLQVFVLAGAMGALGALLWSGRPRHRRRFSYLVRLPVFALPVAAAPLALLTPPWSLGQVPLAQTGAGGALGAFLSGSLGGLLLWAICCALLANLLRVQFGGRGVRRSRVQPNRATAVRGASHRAPARPGVSARPGAPALTALHRLLPGVRNAASLPILPRERSLSDSMAAEDDSALALAESEASSRLSEAFGVLLVVLAAALAVWVLTGGAAPEPMPSLVQAFGVHVFTLLAFVGGFGFALWLREPDLLWRDTDLNRGLPVAALAITGPLAFLGPDWRLGGVSLAEAGAAGEVGAFLADGPLGIGVWLLVLCAFAVVAWPQRVHAGIRLVPGVLARARGGAIAVVLVFWPAEPTDDDEAEPEADAPLPQWLLWQDEADEYTSPYAASASPSLSSR